jgi:hypothetical protein
MHEREDKQMNRKGANGVGIALVIMMLVAIAGAGFIAYKQGLFTKTPETSVSNAAQTAAQVASASKEGDVASIGVYVRDLSADNTNSKVAVAVYCRDNDGTFVIDSTSSSTSAEITGKTSYGKTITCWAFNSTFQTKTPAVVTVDEEYKHILVDGYYVATNGKLQVYNDQYATGTGGVVNVTSVGASGTGTLQKLRYTNNNTNQWFPIGGIYFDTVQSSNISSIDMTGAAVLSGLDHASANVVKSTLSTAVTARTDKWNQVFELDDDSATAGNQPVILQENDYLESGAIQVRGNGNGCTSAGELVSMYSFTKGYSRSTKGATILSNVHETDADSSAVITADITGGTFYCTA